MKSFFVQGMSFLNLFTELVKEGMEKENYIKLEKEKIKEIAKIKKISLVTIYAALKFQTNTPLAMFVRAWALNNGGKLFYEVLFAYVAFSQSRDHKRSNR